MGDAAYGAELAKLGGKIRRSNAHLRALHREVAGLRDDGPKNTAATGHAVGKEINGTVRNGVRRGSKP